eukprot:761416-Hanusia_phi.AAC.7
MATTAFTVSVSNSCILAPKRDESMQEQETLESKWEMVFGCRLCGNECQNENIEPQIIGERCPECRSINDNNEDKTKMCQICGYENIYEKDGSKYTTTKPNIYQTKQQSDRGRSNPSKEPGQRGGGVRGAARAGA